MRTIAYSTFAALFLVACGSSQGERALSGGAIGAGIGAAGGAIVGGSVATGAAVGAAAGAATGALTDENDINLD
ncbi:MAG: YMGG-like glycine zipper-containing protein [Pseudomonadota bacterium]